MNERVAATSGNPSKHFVSILATIVALSSAKDCLKYAPDLFLDSCFLLPCRPVATQTTSLITDRRAAIPMLIATKSEKYNEPATYADARR